MRNVMTVVAVVIMIWAPGFAFGTIGDVYQENFESPDVVGNPPGPTSPPTPYWSDVLVGGAYTTPIVAQDLVTGNLTQHYKDPGYVSSTVYGAFKDWVFTTPGNMPVEFTFSFDFLVRNVDTNNPLRLVFREVDAGGYTIVGLYINQNKVQIRDQGTGAMTLVGTALESTWQHIDLSVNTVAKEISVSLDGGSPVSTTYTTEGAPAQADRLLIFRQGTNPAFYYLDNFVLTEVPEPVTLLLLSIGSVLGLRRQRR